MITANKNWIWLKELPFVEEHKVLVEAVYDQDGIFLSGPKTISIITDSIEGGEKVRGDGPFKHKVIAVSSKWADKIPVGSTVLADIYSGGYEWRDYFVTKPENVWAIVPEDALVQTKGGK